MWREERLESGDIRSPKKRVDQVDKATEECDRAKEHNEKHDKRQKPCTYTYSSMQTVWPSELLIITIAVAEHNSGVVRGLLTFKSRISKRDTSIAGLELVTDHMAANLAENLHSALRGCPVESIAMWMDSMVALYRIFNPGKFEKVFVANKVRKIAQITEEVGIQWRYCPTEQILVDMGGRGASLISAGWRKMNGTRDQSGF